MIVLCQDCQAFLLPTLGVTLGISILATVHITSNHAADLFRIKFVSILSLGVLGLGVVASFIGVRQTLWDM